MLLVSGNFTFTFIFYWNYSFLEFKKNYQLHELYTGKVKFTLEQAMKA